MQHLEVHLYFTLLEEPAQPLDSIPVYEGRSDSTPSFSESATGIFVVAPP